MALRQRHDSIAVVRKKGNDTDDERPGLALDNGRERRLEIAVAASFHDNDLPPQRTRCLKYAARLVLVL